MLERRLWYLMLFAAVSAGAPVGHPPARAEIGLEGLLPEASSLEGWTIAEGPTEYRPDTLWEYLDGGAPRYLSYRFRRLIHVRYQLGDDPVACVTLDVFDMGDELSAFGIYRASLPRGAPRRDWGAEGHRSGTVAAAWTDSIYVHAIADDDRPALVAMMEELLTSVCDQVTSDRQPRLALLDPLPSEGRVPRSERYVASDLLGHAALTGGVLATYEVDGEEAVLFFSDLGTGRAADDAVLRLRAHYETRGVIDSEVLAVGAGGFRFTDPTVGNGAVVRVGRFVAGVHGDLSHDAAGPMLARLVENLAALASSE